MLLPRPDSNGISLSVPIRSGSINLFHDGLWHRVVQDDHYYYNSSLVPVATGLPDSPSCVHYLVALDESTSCAERHDHISGLERIE